jgi:hypothetical protein
VDALGAEAADKAVGLSSDYYLISEHTCKRMVLITDVLRSHTALYLVQYKLFVQFGRPDPHGLAREMGDLTLVTLRLEGIKPK